MVSALGMNRTATNHMMVAELNRLQEVVVGNGWCPYCHQKSLERCEMIGEHTVGMFFMSQCMLCGKIYWE